MEANQGRRARDRQLQSCLARFLSHFQEMMKHSSVLGILYLIAVVLIYCLFVLLLELHLEGDYIKFTQRKVNYAGVAITAGSTIGMVYCLYRRKDDTFVQRCTEVDLKSNSYLMIGVYTFGSGTLIRTIQFLFSFAYCKEDDSTLVFVAFQLVFTVLQILFIQHFSASAFKRKMLVIILLYHIMATNLCIWIGSVIKEAGIFSGPKDEIHLKCVNTSRVAETADRWDPYTAAFTVEFSLIATGVLATIKNQTRLFITNDDQLVYRRYRRTVNPIQRVYVREHGPVVNLRLGFLTGLLFVAILFVSSLSVTQNESKVGKIWGVIAYYVFTLLIYTCQTALLWKLLETFKHFRWQWHPLKSEDNLLILGGFGLFFLLVLNLVAEIDHVRSTTLKDPRAPIMLIGNVYHILLTLFQVTVLIRARRYKFSEFRGNENRHNKLLIDIIPFLVTTYIGFWASYSFFEIKNNDFYPHLIDFLKQYGNIFVGILYPFAIFFYFHSAIMLLDIWQAYSESHREE